MCGVTFIFDSAVEEGALRERSKAALVRLQHRGPDGEGLFSGPGWAMGHRRLSIIDIEGSSQPMLDPSNRYCLSYNGEVYNYQELRAQLERDWPFATQGDTEVVLAGLLLRGPEFLNRMEGMWAIALWDTESKRLFLARDRMGKKPIFYEDSPRGISCASELPALRDLTTQPWHEDHDSTADYLRYGYCLPGYTAWREVREVLPGHYMYWQAGRPGIQQQPFWKLRPGSFTGSRNEARARLRETLARAVQRRLVADVEVGAFLSGGIDSSLICAIVRTELGHPLKSFTVGFPDPSYDERTYAHRAAEYLGTDHHVEELAGYSPTDLERLLLKHVGVPFQDSSILPTALVAQAASHHVKVALSGDGGDELFSGYQRYQARTMLRWYTRLPSPLRHSFEGLVRQMPEPGDHHSRNLLKKAHLFCDAVCKVDEETPYIAPLICNRSLRAGLAPGILGLGHRPYGLPEVTGVDDLGAMMLADALIYLPQDILSKVDRATMAASLEARAPFLDRNVVELAFSFPSSWHRDAFRGKKLLRSAFSGLLPNWLWRRRKQGFAVPIHSWFRSTLGQSLVELLKLGDTGPIEPPAVMEMLAIHRSGARDHGHRLWLIYAYLLWRNRRE